MDQSGNSSKRMKALTEGIDKAILSSFRSINAKELVKECYGKDASIFASDGGDATIDFSSFNHSTSEESDSNNMLANLVQSTLEKLNDKLRNVILSLLKKEAVDDVFFKLEYILNELHRENREKLQNDENDKKVTIKAVKMVSSLLKNLDPVGVVKHQAYISKKKERDKLVAEISALEEENDAMERQVEKINISLRDEIQALQETEEEVSRAVDLCTSSGMS